MSWPTTKDGLLKDIRRERERLAALFAGLTEAEMTARDKPGAWSAKDIMAHITAWEQSLLGWYRAGLKGIKQQMPDWQTPGLIDGLNREIFARNRDRTLAEVQKDFLASYREILKMVEEVPEGDMFTPGKFDWTDKDTLAQYIVVNSSRHYTEHFPALETIRKQYGK
ncbi:MAG: ClbS/DfsB family four-helix bundle protein [Dehalococcoidales bacterium]|jgi:hypothetical protein